MNSYELNLKPIRELLLEIDDKTLRDNLRYEVQQLILEAVDITKAEVEKGIKREHTNHIQELRQELLDDDTEYCCYCNEVKNTFQCCGENHFERFRDMCGEQQLSILENM